MKRLLIIIFATISLPTFNLQSSANCNLSHSEFIYTPKDMKIGDIVMWRPLFGGGSETMTQPVYETNNSCGNYYALIDGEPYKVRVNPNYRKGAIGSVSETCKYMITYKGSNWYFNL